MITIEDLKKIRPHLTEPLNMYEKVISFENNIRYLKDSININEGFYSIDLIDALMYEFSRNFGISFEILAPLKEAMAFRQIDLLRLPLKETPSFALPYLEEETELILFLLSRPFFIKLRESTTPNDSLTDEGRCPVCRSIPCLSSIHENEERIYYCSFCGYHGKWKRIGCPNCLNKRGEKIDIITIEEERGLRLELCQICKNYNKTYQRALFEEYQPGLVDIISIPLDIIAQSKGFTRSSPNPLGMRRIL